MIRFAGFLLAGLIASVAVARTPSATWILTRAEWPAAENANEIISLAPVRAAVQALSASPRSRLAVVHNGDEDGVFWASDLEGWLIALGVPAKRIEDHTGAVPPNELRLRILEGNDEADR